MLVCLFYDKGREAWSFELVWPDDKALGAFRGSQVQPSDPRKGSQSLVIWPYKMKPQASLPSS
jgi:hypothetical protein